MSWINNLTTIHTTFIEMDYETIDKMKFDDELRNELNDYITMLMI